MREQTNKTVDVLGIDVSVMRPDKAVNITMNYINRKEPGTVFFHTAESSLRCQSQDWAAKCVNSCDLVLPGDRYMEHALGHASVGEDKQPGRSQFADRYMVKLLARIARDGKGIFVVTDKEEYLQSLKDDLQSIYPEINMDGVVLKDESEPGIEALVNEINGIIPDIIFLCLSPQSQLNLFREYVPMMNTHLLISIEFILPTVLNSQTEVPRWVEALHLTDFYLRTREKIVGSIFRKTILEESEKESEETVQETDDPVQEIDESESEINEENFKGEE